MKRMLMILVSALLVAGINGCGSSDPKSGTSAVTINLGETKTASPSGKILAASSIPTSVASVRFTISAPDMATIERTVSVEGRSSISETFDVPNGANRHFFIEVMDSSGNVIYRGETYANLDGTPIAIAIPMVSTFTPIVGAKFPIATTTTGEFSASAAFDGTNYLVGMETAYATNTETAQFISQSGSPVGSLIFSGGSGGAPGVAFDGTNYLMTWSDDTAYQGTTTK